MGHSVLLVPVPVLESFVRDRWTHYEPGWVSADPAFTHAHVTLLAPYLPRPEADDLATLADIATTTPAFAYRLEAVTAFPNGVIHVPPVPASPFAELTRRLVRAFPQCPPYDGAFGDLDDLVPHVTLDHHLGGVTTATVAADVGDVLPVESVADRLELHWYDEGDCRALASWPLGVSAAAPAGPAGAGSSAAAPAPPGVGR
ncbi:2'-5' RNA ligase family protein [Nocardioides caeni]|uniref:2'-5' RNA ligase family protein n=1 Tax=Nocardioides caeni TaxID=574700 RepID=A0A4S8NJ18_9ACTN|nr:2'-5' RNA ligase family protein [Nocardioides caeni]THV16121.1 2'-5' RNA ligase family protein [Nocardioides caeni]